MKKKYINQKGLSLIELLAVIVILGIIASIAIPSIQSLIQNQRDKAVMSDIVSLVETARLAHMDNECEDSICTYDSSSDSINFKSTKFSEGTVDFTLGTKKDEVVVKVIINPNTFNGRNALIYTALVEKSGGFKEAELLNVLK